MRNTVGGGAVGGGVTAGQLSARKVLRITAHAYRRWFWRLAATAAVVFGATAVLAVTADVALEHVKHASQPYETALAAYAVIGRFGGTLALVFYAGFLDLYVGDPLYEGRQPTLRQVLRELPWTRLIVADALLAAATQVGLLLFVVPGLLLFTLFALVGPLIIVEGHGTRPAFRRSRSLVWRHFLLVAGLVTLPAMRNDLPFDVFNDFAPVIELGTTPTVITVHPSFPARDLKEFIEVARKAAGGINCCQPAVDMMKPPNSFLPRKSPSQKELAVRWFIALNDPGK